MSTDLATPRLSDDYRLPIQRALAWQLGWLFLTVLLLDQGRWFRFACIAYLAFWAGVVFMLIRRPAGPSLTDKLYLRFAYAAIFVLTNVIAQLEKPDY